VKKMSKFMKITAKKTKYRSNSKTSSS